jgi:hypothetical protein
VTVTAVTPVFPVTARPPVPVQPGAGLGSWRISYFFSIG